MIHLCNVVLSNGIFSKGARMQMIKSPSKGIIALEFLIILPVFIMLLLSMIQISSLLFMRHSILNIAYNGARMAATNPNANTNLVTSYIQKRLSAIGVLTETVNITPSNFSAVERGTPLRVDISVDAGLLVAVSIPIDYNHQQISVSSQMAKEY